MTPTSWLIHDGWTCQSRLQVSGKEQQPAHRITTESTEVHRGTSVDYLALSCVGGSHFGSARRGSLSTGFTLPTQS